MMTRTQISLRREQLRMARKKASQLGVSLAEYVRRLIDRDLQAPQDVRFDVTKLFALGRSGGSNVARHKDDYIADAVETERPR